MNEILISLFSGIGVVAIAAVAKYLVRLRTRRSESLNTTFERCANLPVTLQPEAVRNMRELKTRGVGVGIVQDVRTSEAEMTIILALKRSTATATCVLNSPSPDLVFLKLGEVVRFEGRIDEIDVRSVRVIDAKVSVSRWF